MFDLNKLAIVKVGIATDDTIRNWSYAEKHGTKPGAGEVTKPETINYRSQKPETDGLFCERIFGPYKDYECHCGKYKKVRYKGQVCEKCGVEVTNKAVRRERMGYINLAGAAHIWYTKGTPSKMALLLDIPPKQLEEVIYFQSHIVTNPGNCRFLSYKEVLDERDSRDKFEQILSSFLDEKVIDEDSQPRDWEQCNEYIKMCQNRSEPIPFNPIAEFIERYTGAHFSWGSSGEDFFVDENNKLVAKGEKPEQYGDRYTDMEGVETLLKQIDLQAEMAEIQKELSETKDSKSPKRIKLLKRLEVVKDFYESKQQPRYMIQHVLPVIPPDLRPMLMLDGGRFATSDLNDLYRRVIIRNNRLKKLVIQSSPKVIIVNELRMLQEAVDSLIDNGRRNRPQTGVSGRPLKSLSSSLKGKQGRFRQNLLGKRVDYSGRSVICVGPFLRIDQCGLPREMAVQLFKPFIIHYLMVNGFAVNTHAAEAMIARFDDKVFDALEKIVPQHPVLLNRAPTLHRLGIQAFRPVLVDGSAIRLHPLVCPGFNADFDGDQMAVHVPLSKKAQQEAFDLMMATWNLLSPRDATVLAIPVQDIVVGHYYLTSEQTPADYRKQADTLSKVVNKTTSESEKEDAYKQIALLKRFEKMDGHAYRNFDEVMRALDAQEVQMNTRIAIPAAALHKDYFTEEEKRSYLITTPGKLIFNNMFPHDFPYINDSPKHDTKVFEEANKNWFCPMGTNIHEFMEKWNPTAPVAKGQLAEIINELFHRYHARRTAVLLDRIKDTGYDQCTKLGLTISLDDINMVPHRDEHIAEGEKIKQSIEQDYQDGLLTDEQRHHAIISDWTNIKQQITKDINNYMLEHPRNPVFMMAASGARGSLNNFVQLFGMRGIMQGPNNTNIEIPVKHAFREGMNVSEYFIAAHGSRKGSTDTALKTADSGYLTRRLVDVSHAVVIREEDCGVDHGFKVHALIGDKNAVLLSVGSRVLGRFAAVDIVDPNTGELICPQNGFIDESVAKAIDEHYIDCVEIRSLLTCQAKEGVCVKCYGRNMATGEMAKIGDAVGIMAAQSIGEPGTQLTMRTFHEGGTAGSDITQGLPRVQELLEVRSPKGQATIAPISGTVVKIFDDTKERKDGKNAKTVKTIKTGKVHFVIKNDKEEIDQLSATVNPKASVNIGDKVVAGQALTIGSLDPKEILKYTDIWTTARYLIDEVQKVYNAQGINISDKHIEVVIRKMISKMVVTDAGDTDLIPGLRCDLWEFTEKNQKAFENGFHPAIAYPMILGVTKAALQTDSFLSAASFQETTRILTDANIAGAEDYLRGLKENIMIGKLIPAGTGLKELDPNEDYIAKEEVSEDDFNAIASGFTETHFYPEDTRGYGADISGIQDYQNIPLSSEKEVNQADDALDNGSSTQDGGNEIAETVA